MPVTIRDLAARLGVSKSTVSRGLRNDPGVSRATARRVQEVAQASGYRPVPLVSALASLRWSKGGGREVAVGFVADDWPRGTVRGTDFFRRLVALAPRFGFRIELHRTADYRDAGKLVRVVEARGIRGLVIGPLADPGVAGVLPVDRLAAVSYGVGPIRVPVPVVLRDPAYAARLAWERLSAVGCRRIGASLPHLDWSDDDRFLYGAHLAERSRAPGRHPPIDLHDYRRPEAFIRWVERTRPDGVIGHNNRFYFDLLAAGFRIPDDLAFASLAQSSNDVRIAGVRTEHERIARAVLAQLDSQVRRGRCGAEEAGVTVLIQGRWVEGGSCRLPKK